MLKVPGGRGTVVLVENYWSEGGEGKRDSSFQAESLQEVTSGPVPPWESHGTGMVTGEAEVDGE